MIDTTKQYKTRSGLDVRIFATDGAGEYPVLGAVKDDDGWEAMTWTADGRNFPTGEGDWDLVEITPEHTRWYVVSEHTGYATQEGAQAAAREFYSECPVAVASVTFREGDGL